MVPIIIAPVIITKVPHAMKFLVSVEGPFMWKFDITLFAMEYVVDIVQISVFFQFVRAVIAHPTVDAFVWDLTSVDPPVLLILSLTVEHFGTLFTFDNRLMSMLL